MSTSYLPKLNPKVGKGLGGIPEKPAVGGGGGAQNRAHIFDAPILNRQISTTFTAKTSFQTLTLNFTPVDIRNVFFEIRMMASGSSGSQELITFPNFNDQSKYPFVGTSGATNAVVYTFFMETPTRIKFKSNTTNSNAECTIIATEYDLDVLFTYEINANDDTNQYTLPTPITDIKNVWASGIVKPTTITTGGIPSVYGGLQRAFSSGSNDFAALTGATSLEGSVRILDADTIDVIESPHAYGAAFITEYAVKQPTG